MDDEYKKVLFDLMWTSTREKFALLPILAGLFLAILAIGVSGDLFEVNSTIKYIATCLLLLMILSLQVYYSETISLGDEARRELNKHLGKADTETTLTFLESINYLISGKINGVIKEKDFFKRFSSQLPAYALLIIWWMVFLLIYEIWK